MSSSENKGEATRFYLDAINPDQSYRGPQMRVIAAGLPRCATSSVQVALESLGYFPCMHMAHVSPHGDRQVLCEKAMFEKDTQKRRKILHQIFDGYQATSDFPGFYFIDDLMDMYPDAQIVLNQRKDGAKGWQKSMTETMAFFNSWYFILLCGMWRTDRMAWKINRHVRVLGEQKFGDPVPTEAAYDNYQEYVRKECKKRNRDLLEWQPQHGWEPLCNFVGRPVPKDTAFPRLNDGPTMRMLQRFLLIRGCLTWVAIIAGSWATYTYWPVITGFVAKILA
jgi:hypothetical protein